MSNRYIGLVRETDREGDVPFAEVILGPFPNEMEANDACENYVIFLGVLHGVEEGPPSLYYEWESYPVEGAAEAMIAEVESLMEIDLSAEAKLWAMVDVEKFYHHIEELRPKHYPKDI